MDLLAMLRQAGIVSLLTLLIDLVPLAMAVAYVLRPTERRLALMRPLSLAGLFSALSGGVVGFLHTLRGYAVASQINEELHRRMAWGAAESMVPMFVGFGCLAVAWLLVAAGMSRNAAS